MDVHFPAITFTTIQNKTFVIVKLKYNKWYLIINENKCDFKTFKNW